MTSRGRGRGRARSLADESNIPGGLRDGCGDSDEQNKDLPAETEPKPTLSFDDIQSILQDSRTYSDQNDVKKVLICTHNFVRSEDDVKKVAELIYNKCMEDSSLAKRGAEICDSLSTIEINGTKFRNSLLTLVQTDYKARKELIHSNATHFNGFVAFMCEIFNIMRTTTNEVFKPLLPAIFDCFYLVLGKEENYGVNEEAQTEGETAAFDEDACDVVALQLLSIGRLLEQNGGDKMRALMDHVRTCIIHSRSSPRVRCSLLEVIEGYARGWEPAHNDTTKFYCDMAVDIISGLVL